MATDRRALVAVLAAAASLLWPALWNGYPIVFADTGTYLSQAIHLYAGWDRPVFYSLFLLPLHGTLTLWPVVVAQALLTAWVLWVVCRVLIPRLTALGFTVGVAVLSSCSWLPWIVSEVMPDLFTPLLVLLIFLLAWAPELLSRREQVILLVLESFFIASQQSSLPLACVLLTSLGLPSFLIRLKLHSNFGRSTGAERYLKPTQTDISSCVESRFILSCSASDSARCAPVPPKSDRPPDLLPRADSSAHASPQNTSLRRRSLLLILPPILAMVSLCSANLAAHGRFTVSPFGNVFLLARVIYDGPGMNALEQNCEAARWRLCSFLNRFPATSDEFLWSADSPLYLAGGPKIVSAEAGAIIRTALSATPMAQAAAALRNTLEQLVRFDSGDGLEPWPEKVTLWVDRDFPTFERNSYAAARQQSTGLRIPQGLALIHRFVALAGVAGAIFLLPVALHRRAACAGLLLAVLLALPVSAAITGSLSTPHDRYQSRIMWLPAAALAISLVSLRQTGRRRNHFLENAVAEEIVLKRPQGKLR